MKNESRFAARVFRGAGIYGILVLAPQYLLETGIAPALPVPITRPEQFYGLIGVALVWQFAFLLIARDVRRFRPLMLVGVIEKVSFGLPVLLLYARGRVGADVLVFGTIDLFLGVLFVLAYRATPAPERLTTPADRQ
ncbi:MAG: hypothetical protein ACHQQ3_10920 [Gemmatimonadales bacterium]